MSARVRLVRFVGRGCAALVAASSLALAGCSHGGSSATGGPAHWLRFAVGAGDPNYLNIHLDPSATTGYLAELTQAYLARYDRNGKPVPELATVIPTQRNGGISADGKTITWHLRHGVRWSDGAPFSADDVAFSVNTINNKNNNEEQGTEGWELIEKMDEPDPDTIVFHLKRPYADYLPTFFGTAADNPCILPKHILGGLHDINTTPYNAKPVGIGPFRITAWNRGDSIELEANPYYFRGKPKLDRITFKIIPTQDTVATQLQTGELDLWPLVPPTFIDRLKALDTLTMRVRPNFRTTNLDFNVRRPLVGDVRVRRAIQLAVDRAKLIASVLHGYGFRHDGVDIPLDAPHGDSVLVPFDPAKARALLDAAGWKVGADGIRVKDGVRLSLETAYPQGNTELDGSVELIRENLRAVGIEVASKKYAPGIFRALKQNGGILYNGRFDMTLYGRTLQTTADVGGLYGCAHIPPAGENATEFCDPAADALLVSVENTYDDAARAAIFKRFEGLIVAEVPTFILYAWQGGVATSTRVVGFDPPLLTPFDDMMNVDVR
jgi:peptide/nickel transport system substrate-binding protein